MKISIKDKIVSFSAYVFGVPALYIVLTEDRNKSFIGYHGAQAFKLWCFYFGIFFAYRFLVDLVWKIRYLPGLGKVEIFLVLGMASYSLFCGYLTLRGKTFDIPF
jgi:uncharacterized membrane protein